jgi:hypothetical protein
MLYLMKKRATVYLVAISAVLIITAVLLVLSLFTTNPTRLGPAGVTFWFINAKFAGYSNYFFKFSKYLFLKFSFP